MRLISDSHFSFVSMSELVRTGCLLSGYGCSDHGGSVASGHLDRLARGLLGWLSVCLLFSEGSEEVGAGGLVIESG